jgi:hypothetical protein
MNPEVRLLLCCVRNELNKDCTETIYALLHQDLDWNKISQLGSRNGISPILYKNLKTTFPDLVPNSVLNNLKEDYLFNLRNNLHLTNQLFSVLKILNENNIQTIPYKGPILTTFFYGNLGLRQFSDLDIIIHHEDIKTAKELLQSKGYKLTWPKGKLTDKQERTHIQSKYNYRFVHEDSGVIIELHWNVTPKYFAFPRNPEWLWHNLVPVTFSDKSFYTFTPEDYLIILCVHGSNHCWIRLNWIIDISKLISKNPLLNWNQILNDAVFHRSERMLLLGLLLSHEIIGTNFPDLFWERLNYHQEVRSLALKIISKLNNNSWVGSSLLEVPRFHLRSMDNLIDRWKYFLYIQEPSSKDWAFFNLPESLYFLYYLLRPIRLGIEYGFIPIQQKFTQVRN